MAPSIPHNQCLTVIYHIEPGCLGPQGDSHIDTFCGYAQKSFDALELDYVVWQVEPRLDKSVAEIQFKINQKELSRAQAEKYLKLFEEDIIEFESLIGDTLTHLVEDYFRR